MMDKMFDVDIVGGCDTGTVLEVLNSIRDVSAVVCWFVDETPAVLVAALAVVVLLMSVGTKPLGVTVVFMLSGHCFSHSEDSMTLCVLHSEDSMSLIAPIHIT